MALKTPDLRVELDEGSPLRRRGMTKFNPLWRKREPAICTSCGVEFQAVSAEVRRGKGKTCSRSCAAKLQGPRDQSGNRNPNWKEGIPPNYRAHKRLYRTRHPERSASHMAVRDAIIAGTLERQSCEQCGCAKAEAHHDDYSKPLVVRWLCRKHHREYHYGAAA